MMKIFEDMKKAVVQKGTDMYAKYFVPPFEQFYADVDSAYYNAEVYCKDILDTAREQLERQKRIKTLEYLVANGQDPKVIYKLYGFEIIENVQEEQV